MAPPIHMQRSTKVYGQLLPIISYSYVIQYKGSLGHFFAMISHIQSFSSMTNQAAASLLQLPVLARVGATHQHLIFHQPSWQASNISEGQLAFLYHSNSLLARPIEHVKYVYIYIYICVCVRNMYIYTVYVHVCMHIYIYMCVYTTMCLQGKYICWFMCWRVI